ncbi:MAG: MFS transporter [Treponema sp.]|nr:MFS transporter [Treponema sp.]
MASNLSPYRLAKARDLFNIFSVFNALSWQFLTGNVVALFALRMGASPTYIGVLSAVLYLAFFFLPLGRALTNRISMVKIFSYAWGGRSLGMIPLLFVPIIFAAGHQDLALLITLLGVAAFHIIRGLGMIANNPVLSHLSKGPDQGSYLTQIQVLQSAVVMFAGFIIAMLLGRDPPLFLYTIIIAVGIITGIISGVIVNKIPEPEAQETGKGKNLIEVIKETMEQPSLRRFIIIVLLVALVSGVSRTFLVVYAREVFDQSDGMVALFAVFGGLGHLMIGLFIKFLVDRVGAKPLFTICVIISLLSMIPVLFFPASQSDNLTTVILFLSFLFFMLSFGWLGSEGIMQTYFMAMVPVEKMTDMGMIYFFSFGIAGVVGSLFGGVFLDVVVAISGSYYTSFRILFLILIIITGITLIPMRKMVSLGALPFISALGVLFSFRELRAISLLERLKKSSNAGEEEAILDALHDTPSKLAIKGLLTRIKSPRLSVRMESIRAIDALKNLNEDAERALMDDIINNPYTSAYRSARALGNHGVFHAVPLLRELVLSNDYMLSGEAMIALAKLKDTGFMSQIESIIKETSNPRLQMAGAEALGIYGVNDSLPVLLDMLRVANPPPYLADEVVLAMAGILGIQHKFYPLLVRFLADETQASTLAQDEAESAYEHAVSVHVNKRSNRNPKLKAFNYQTKSFQSAILEYIKTFSGSKLSRWIREIPDELVNEFVRNVFIETILDEVHFNDLRLQLLIVHWASHELRLWTSKLKAEF